VARLRALAQEAEARITFIERGGVPYGFRNMQEFRDFGGRLRSEFERGGHRDAEHYLRGSALTGRSFKEGRPFDRGPNPSDLDIAIVSQTLVRRAEELRVPLMGQGRTVAIKRRQLDALGLTSQARRLSDAQGRDVNFMIYRSLDVIKRRGPYRSIP